jgi:hypothetical protein
MGQNLALNLDKIFSLQRGDTQAGAELSGLIDSWFITCYTFYDSYMKEIKW